MVLAEMVIMFPRQIVQKIPGHEVRGRQRPRLQHLERAGELQSSFSF